MNSNKDVPFTATLVAGAAAGLAVDVTLFPLDTVKTRLQSAEGFRKAGGFRNFYAGIGSVVVGSSPGSAVFFCTYEMIKSLALPSFKNSSQTPVHMLAASCGEVAACLVRVPTEVIKQRAQANSSLSSWHILQRTVKSEGFRGLYRGYFSTIIREIPFSLIQFPVWEYLKQAWSHKEMRSVEPWQSSLCGALAGGIAAGMTTPIDVAKTRIMLAEKGSLIAEGNIVTVLNEILKERGFRGLFAGMYPRVLWITLGGAIFFGAYEKSKKILCSFVYDRHRLE